MLPATGFLPSILRSTGEGRETAEHVCPIPLPQSEMPDWSRYAAIRVPKDTLQQGLQSTHPFPKPALMHSVAQGRAELHLTHWQPLEVRMSTNPFECSWSSAVSLSFPRIHTRSPRPAVPLPEPSTASASPWVDFSDVPGPFYGRKDLCR